MKQFARTMLCVVLAAAMVFALGAGAFAASVDNAKHYDTYAFIGDSIAAGHSLPEYTAAAGIGDDILVKDSYAQLVSDAVTAHTFVPAGAVTRAQIAVITARLLGAQA